MAESLETLRTRFAKLAESTQQSPPVGIDCTYDPAFEAVKGELDKLTALAGEVPNWRLVVEQSEQLLLEKTKDQRLLFWLILGAAQLHGPIGLAAALDATRLTCQSHWEQMNPPVRRLRARANLVEWLAEQVSTWAGGYKPVAADREGFVAVEQAIVDLDTAMRDWLKELHPGLASMRAAVRERARDLPEAAPAPAASRPSTAPAVAASSSPVPQESSAAPVAQVPVSPAGVSGPPIAIPDVPKVSGGADVLPALRAMGKSIMDSARVLRREDPSNAWAYRLQRTGAWLAVKAPPPAEGTKTKIPPPAAEHRKKLDALKSAGNWMDLVSAAEDLSGTFLFWLDLHFAVATAMDRLGALFISAREVVGRQVVAFVEQFPAVAELTFADGTPFADAATLAWLDEEKARLGGGGGAASGNQQASEEDAQLAERFTQAEALAADGKTAEALGLGIELAVRAPDARSRFKARLRVARMALLGERRDIALALASQLADESERHSLETWEPELAAGAYSLFLQANSGQGPEFESAFTKLARIHPAVAFRYGKK